MQYRRNLPRVVEPGSPQLQEQLGMGWVPQTNVVGDIQAVLAADLIDRVEQRIEQQGSDGPGQQPIAYPSHPTTGRGQAQPEGGEVRVWVGHDRDAEGGERWAAEFLQDRSGEQAHVTDEDIGGFIGQHCLQVFELPTQGRRKHIGEVVFESADTALLQAIREHGVHTVCGQSSLTSDCCVAGNNSRSRGVPGLGQYVADVVVHRSL